MNRWKMHATLESLSFPEIWFQISAISARFSHFFCCIQSGRHALPSKGPSARILISKGPSARILIDASLRLLSVVAARCGNQGGVG
jgi:hypothetical protein